jgi:hypothetical protein
MENGKSTMMIILTFVVLIGFVDSDGVKDGAENSPI